MLLTLSDGRRTSRDHDSPLNCMMRYSMNNGTFLHWPPVLCGRTIPLEQTAGQCEKCELPRSIQDCIKNSPFSRSIHDTVVSLLANRPDVQMDYILVNFIFYLRIFYKCIPMYYYLLYSYYLKLNFNYLNNF